MPLTNVQIQTGMSFLMDISQMPGSCYTAARKGGDRFCVGSGPRYAPGQADCAANKAKEYQFESLHKIYFYDAWRWKIELNLPDSPLRLPPPPAAKWLLLASTRITPD